MMPKLRRFRKLAGVFSLTAVATTLLILLCQSREPIYQGRPLSSWLKKRAEGIPLWDVDESTSESEVAIRAIGAARATPILLSLIKSQDSALRSWAVQKQYEWHLDFLHLMAASEKQTLGVAGFRALGANAATAVPELRTLLNDSRFGAVAIEALIFIGPPAQEPACSALTNNLRGVRILSAAYLRSVVPNFEVFLKNIKIPLADADPLLRRAAVHSIGSLTNHALECVPPLIGVLAEVDDNVCSEAAAQLVNFGTNALEGEFALRLAARQGGRRTKMQALRTLLTVAPQATLRGLLDDLRDHDPATRARAAEVLGFSLRRLRDREKQEGRLVPNIPGQPEDSGKPLSYWVAQRELKGNLTGEARYVIESMPLEQTVPALVQMIGYKDPIFDLYDDELSYQALEALSLLRQPFVVFPEQTRLVMLDEDR